MMSTVHQALQCCAVRQPQLCPCTGIFHYFSQHAFLDSACQSCAQGGFTFKKVLTSSISEYKHSAGLHVSVRSTGMRLRFCQILSNLQPLHWQTRERDDQQVNCCKGEYRKCMFVISVSYQPKPYEPRAINKKRCTSHFEESVLLMTFLCSSEFL